MPSRTVNLYIVSKRQQQIEAIIVAAHDAKEAVQLIANERFGEYKDWRLGNTYTRRIVRNVAEEPAIITVVYLHAMQDFRQHNVKEIEDV